MARNIIAALDIGTSTIQTVIAEKQKGDGSLHILGMGIAPSGGVRRGTIVDLEDATNAIQQSVRDASRAAGVSVRSVWLGVGGAHVTVASSRGVVAVSRADGEISPEDVRRAIAAAESFIPKNPNKEIIHMIPRDFRVDNESGIKDPVGMHGIRLEADTLMVECSSSFLKNLLKCVESAGLKAEDYVFSPLAAAEAVLNKRQKELGVLLLDIGGGTASFMIFEDGTPIHAGVVPIGGGHITNDIALGFRTHINAAEQIKLTYGSCLPEEFSKKDKEDVIRLEEFLSPEGYHATVAVDAMRDDSNAKKKQASVRSHIDTGAVYSRRVLAEMVEARLQDLFELLGKELKKINRSQLLPAGVVLIGGSATLPGIVELTKREIKLPAELGMPEEFLGSIDEKLAPSLCTALGLVKWADARRQPSDHWMGRVSKVNNSSVMRWLKSLLP